MSITLNIIYYLPKRRKGCFFAPRAAGLRRKGGPSADGPPMKKRIYFCLRPNSSASAAKALIERRIMSVGTQ